MTTLLTNLTMWTGHSAETTHGHVIVADGRIRTVAAGPYRGGSGDVDDVVDLGGGALLPAFGDGHAHPVFGILERDGPDIHGASTVDQVVDAVGRFARAHPDLDVIHGASYSPTIVPDGVFDAAWLDRVVADRPVVLRSTDYHTVWCNTEALRRAGITTATPEPPIGRIVRRPDGSPRGTLREWDACAPVLALLPPRPAPHLRDAVTDAGRLCASRGLTWVLDAWVDVDSGLVDAYLDAHSTTGLDTRFDLALRADPRSWREQRHVFARERQRVAAAVPDASLRANTVKFFADGIIEAGTALLLADYCDHPHDRGMAVWDPAELRAAVAAADLDRFQVHIHAIGDGGVRMALDAIEHACRSNPPWRRRPTVTHVQLVHPSDLPRFAELGVVANVQPFWAHYDDFQSLLTTPRLGDRSDAQFPTADMLKSGAHLSFGTDWPVSTLHPMECLRVAVTRAIDGGPPWLPDQCLTVEQALRIYTAGASHQAGTEGVRGTIAPGMVADLVWLSEDPFRVAPRDLASIGINGTWLAGRQTYRSG